ncbi:MAG: DUF6529 family protein [Solirubrobacteraceae bacterium]
MGSADGEERARGADEERQLVSYVAAHSVVLLAQLGVEEPVAVERLDRLVRLGLLRRAPRLSHQRACFQITRDGLEVAGVRLPAPEIDLRRYRQDLAAAWLWLAARAGAFGKMDRSFTRREMVAADATVRSHAGLSADLSDELRWKAADRAFGIPVAGAAGLHYPDLCLVLDQGRVPIELAIVPIAPVLLERLRVKPHTKRTSDSGRHCSVAWIATATSLGSGRREQRRPEGVSHSAPDGRLGFAGTESQIRMSVSEPTEVLPQRDPAAGRLLLAGVLGAVVALSLGIYGSAHAPASDLVITLGFTNTITMKVWLATLAVAFAVVQLLSALWMYGRLPFGKTPVWLGPVHRVSGRVAFLVSLPVAYHCLYQLGFQHSSARVLIHSVLGCAFYGAFATKVVVVRSRNLPGWALPVAGGVAFAALAGTWLASGLWYINNSGFPSP